VLQAAHLAELVGELLPLVQGATIVEVHAHPPRDLVLVLRRDDAPRPRFLRVSADPEAGRVHLELRPAPAHRGPLGPFFRLATERLLDSPLRALEALPNDRIVRLVAGARAARCTLVAELTGRHANLVLLDAGGRVEAVLVTPPEAARSAARLAVGARWEPPPSRRGPTRAAPLLAEALPEPPPPPGPRAPLEAPLSWRVEAALGRATARRLEDAARDDLVVRLEQRAKVLAARERGLATRLEQAAAAERLRQDGELLKARLGELRPGTPAVEVEDWFVEGAPRRVLRLDPALSPLENVERLFREYKKRLRAHERVPDEIERTRAEAACVAELLGRARSPEADVPALEREALERGLLKERQTAPRGPRVALPRVPYRTFRGLHGGEIRVGRTARDNDVLSIKLSRGNDVWLHTADAPGSHVVLRLVREPPDDEEVLDAAHLAIHFSPLRDSPRVDVHVARCKQVKKPRGAPPGLVTLSGGRTVRVRVEPARLERLLATRPPQPPTVPGEPP